MKICCPLLRNITYPETCLPSLSTSYNNENNPQMAPQASLEWKSSPPMDYSGQPGHHHLHSDIINHLCFSYKLRIRKRGSDRKWWKEQEKRNTGKVLSPTYLSTLGKSHYVNLSLQRQRFRSICLFAHRFKLELRKRIQNDDNNSSKH